MVKWRGYDARSEVSKWTKWKKKTEELPNVAGVYIYANSKHDVKYIGKAGAGRLNEEAKSAMKVRKKDKGASLVRGLITNNNVKAKSLEDYLIKKYKPSNNKNQK